MTYGFQRIEKQHQDRVNIEVRLLLLPKDLLFSLNVIGIMEHHFYIFKTLSSRANVHNQSDRSRLNQIFNGGVRPFHSEQLVRPISAKM